MRRIPAILVTTFAVLMLTSGLHARDKHNWENVGKLKPGSSVLVVLWKGDTLSGRLVDVSSSGLRLSSSYPPPPGTSPTFRIERNTIKTIVLLRNRRLPNPGRWMLTGALVGGGVGVTAGAIRDATDRNNGRWLTGGLAGAGVGFLGSCAVLTGVGVAALLRHNKVVYEANVAPTAVLSGTAGSR